MRVSWKWLQCWGGGQGVSGLFSERTVEQDWWVMTERMRWRIQAAEMTPLRAEVRRSE